MAVGSHLDTGGVEWLMELDAYAVPVRAYQGDAGYDVFASKSVLLEPNATRRIETGVRVVCPTGWWLEVMDRSSMALKGLFCVGGVVDEKYLGTIGVIMHNSTRDPFVVNRGMKVAQFVFKPRFVDPREHELAVRGEMRHGSSGQ
jgi:dUTP pyrophosphatase